MALETATYIADLVPANPNSTDGVGQADDHIRQIKQVLQNTFPGLSAPVDLSGGGTFLKTTGGVIEYLRVKHNDFSLHTDTGAPGGNTRTYLGWWLGSAMYDVCSPSEGWVRRVVGSCVLEQKSDGVYLHSAPSVATNAVATRGYAASVAASAVAGINTADYVKKSDGAPQTVAGSFQASGGKIVATTAGDPAVVVYKTGQAASGLMMGSGNTLIIAQTDAAGNYISARALIDASNNFVATGNVHAYSDIRLKTNIHPLEWRGDYDLQPIVYDRTDTNHRGVSGFSAQEVQSARPSLVTEGPDGTLAVNYNGLLAELWARVQELEDRVEALEWQ